MPDISSARPTEFDDFIKKHPDIDYVDAVFLDMNGALRGKRVPASDARKLFTVGMQMPGDIFMLDALGEMTNPLGLGSEDGDPDSTSYPVPGTLVTVGKPPHRRAQVMMTMLAPGGGKRLEVEPRNVLIKVMEQFARTGLQPVVAVELEFFLVDKDRTVQGMIQPPLCPTTGVREKAISVYGIDDLDRYDAFLAAVADECERQKIPATTAVAEYAPGQFEINLHHVDDPVLAADHAALLRPLIKHVAKEQGMKATFMAKPYSHTAGSGMHVHLSLTRNGKNVFAAPDGLSDMLRHSVGGLAAVMHECMAIFSPNYNAFRRFVPNLFVPVNRRWGINNRSTGLRIPAGDADSTRIEHRVAGADANPYLVLAAILIGIQHGIENKIDPGSPHEGDASDFQDPTVPFETIWSLEELQNGKVLRSVLGSYVDVYAESKRVEYKRFHSSIPAHEHDWYL